MELETIGSDLEVFLKKKNKLVSAEGKVGGTKEEPLELDNGVSVQEDNIMAEFNVVPATSKKEFLANVNNALFQLRSRVDPLEVSILGSGKFTKKEILTEQAMEFGCDPDVSAWGVENTSMPDPEDPLRYCGGHIHLGYLDLEMDKESIEISRVIITRLLDLYIGIPSIVIGDQSDKNRNKYYGEPGRYRDKEYGLEYRTVSNFWARSNKLIGWVYEMSSRAVREAGEFMRDNPGSTDILDRYDSLRVREAINTFDQEFAQTIADSFELNIPKHEDKKEEVHQL